MVFAPGHWNDSIPRKHLHPRMAEYKPHDKFAIWIGRRQCTVARSQSLTRRDLFKRVALASASGYVSCTAYPQSVRRWLENAEDRDGIVIIGLGLWALTLRGKPAGRLILPDCCIALPSISSDGNCVAWIPNSSLPYPVGKSEPVLQIRRWGSAIETIRYRARFADWVADRKSVV